MLKIIVAVARGGVIGCKGMMPWHLPEDLAYFKRTTMGSAVIMGRKTYESIGRPLPGRVNVVVSRSVDFQPVGVCVYHSLPEAVAAYPDAFVIGGAEIYRQALPMAGRLHVTRIDADFQGDTYFPVFDLSDWQLVSSERLGINTTVEVYDRL